MRLGDLPEHVREDALDGRQAAHFVERILEIGVVAVELGKAGDAGRGEFVVEDDQFVEGHVSLR